MVFLSMFIACTDCNIILNLNKLQYYKLVSVLWVPVVELDCPLPPRVDNVVVKTEVFPFVTIYSLMMFIKNVHVKKLGMGPDYTGI